MLMNVHLLKVRPVLLNKTGSHCVGKYAKIFRSVDDLNITNSNSEFQQCFMEIYPQDLQLYQQNNTSDMISFLDLDLTVTKNE